MRIGPAATATHSISAWPLGISTHLLSLLDRAPPDAELTIEGNRFVVVAPHHNMARTALTMNAQRGGVAHQYRQEHRARQRIPRYDGVRRSFGKPGRGPSPWIA